MSEPNSLPSHNRRDEIELRAADFLQRQRFWDWSDRDEAMLAAWLEESLDHRVAYLRLEAGAGRAERLAALRPPKQKPTETRGGEDKARRRIVLSLLATAASIALVTLGFIAARDFLRPSDRTFATDVGGRALLKFADGTQLELDTDTAVRYRMTSEERTVWLDRGAAYFRVAHDDAHPFVVIIGDHRVTDLGTEFLVRHDASALEVALVKGRAELSSDDKRAPVATLTPGDDAIATSTSVIVAKKTSQQLADELAWQRGVLVFRNTRLEDAVREFNRYNRTKLAVADAAVGGMKIGGEFKTDNIDDFLRLAQAVLKVHADREGDAIVISRD